MSRFGWSVYCVALAMDRFFLCSSPIVYDFYNHITLLAYPLHRIRYMSTIYGGFLYNLNVFLIELPHFLKISKILPIFLFLLQYPVSISPCS